MPLTAGEELFARYAFPPNDLGHCGPPGAELLLAEASTGDSEAVRARLEQFEGAWPYLRVLAATAGADDGLDLEVVSAYWLGGRLLDRVESADFRKAVSLAFGTQPGVRERLADIPDTRGVAADHVFHVFVVYPWVALLGSAGDVARSVLDSCRVRWGTVESVEGDLAGVRSRPLTWDGAALGLGAERVEVCRWARGPHSFVRGLKVGDEVSLHWNWVCDRLKADQTVELAERTQRQLALTNEWLARRAPIGQSG